MYIFPAYNLQSITNRHTNRHGRERRDNPSAFSPRLPTYVTGCPLRIGHPQHHPPFFKGDEQESQLSLSLKYISNTPTHRAAWNQPALTRLHRVPECQGLVLKSLCVSLITLFKGLWDQGPAWPHSQPSGREASWRRPLGPEPWATLWRPWAPPRPAHPRLPPR